MAEKHIEVDEKKKSTTIYYQHNLNDVTRLCVGVKVGAGKDWIRGEAHLKEHASYLDIPGSPELGIPAMSREEIDRLFRKYAVKDGAYTTQDSIYFTFAIPNPVLEDVLKIASDMLVKNDFVDEDLDAEKQVILHEKYVREDEIKDVRAGILDYLFNKSTFGIDRLIGSEKSLSRIDAKELARFTNKWFVSENLIVSVVSNLPYSDIKPLVNKYFINRLPSNPKNEVVPQKRTYEFANQVIAINDPTARSFNINFILKGKRSYEKNELFTTFEDWYFNGLAGRLIKELRHTFPLTYTPSFYNFEPKDIRLKVFDITTTPENANLCVYLMTQMFSDLIRNGITEDEFNEWQQHIMYNREHKTELKTRNSTDLFDAVLVKQNPFVKNFYGKLLRLTREDINDYFRKTYTNSKLTLGYDGNIDLAEYSLLMDEPYNTLSEDKINELYSAGLLPNAEEVLLMYNPKVQLKQWIAENYPKKKPLKPKFTKEASKQKRQLIKDYLEEVKAAEQKENEQIASEPEKPVEHPVVKSDDELVM